jgi:chemotaxis response regulator CheB
LDFGMPKAAAKLSAVDDIFALQRLPRSVLQFDAVTHLRSKRWRL